MSRRQTYPVAGIIPVPYHHTMLADRNRCHAFERAIDRTVRPGDVVLEAGAGTGLLAYFAAKKARKVYAIEADPTVAALGQQLIRLNGLEGRVEYTAGLAEDHMPSEPVDVVVCEMMHAALAVEQQVPVLNRLRERLTEAFPGYPYRVIPEQAVSYCQLLQIDYDFYGYKAPFIRLENFYVPDPAVRTLSPTAPYLHADFRRTVPENIAATLVLTANAAGTVNAVRTITQTVLSLDMALPPSDRLIDWYLHYLVLPLPEPLPVEPGDGVEVVLLYRAGCPLEEIVYSARPTPRLIGAR